MLIRVTSELLGEKSVQCHSGCRIVLGRKIFPFFLSRFMDWTDIKIDIRQTNRRKTNVITHIRELFNNVSVEGS